MEKTNIRLAAENGCLLIADTNARTGKVFYGFVAQEDTVIDTLTGEDSAGTAVDFLDTIGLSGKTLKQGALIIVPQLSKITAITLTSGSVIAY